MTFVLFTERIQQIGEVVGFVVVVVVVVVFVAHATSSSSSVDGIASLGAHDGQKRFVLVRCWYLMGQAPRQVSHLNSGLVQQCPFSPTSVSAWTNRESASMN